MKHAIIRPSIEHSNAVAPGVATLPGLGPFDDEHTSLFLGREPETNTVEKLVANHRVVLITGHRWVGKTSLIKSGLIPRLQCRLGSDRRHVRYEDIRFDTDPLISYLHEARRHEQSPSPYSSRLLIVDSLEEITGPAHDTLGDRIFRRIWNAVRDNQIERLVLICRTECISSMTRQFPSARNLFHNAATYEIRPLRTHRIRQLLSALSTRLGISIQQSTLTSLLEELRRTSARQGERLEDSSITMPVVSLLISHIALESTTEPRVYTLDRHQRAGGLPGIVGALFAGLAARLSGRDLAAIASSMSLSRCSGRRCKGDQLGRQTESWREIRVGYGAWTRSERSLPTLFVGVGEQGLALRYDCVSTLWPELAKEFQLAEWDGAPIHHLAQFYFRVGKIPRVLGLQFLGQAQPRTEGQKVFVAKLRSSSRIMRLLRFLLHVSVVSILAFTIILGFMVYEYRGVVSDLDQSLRAQTSSEITDILAELEGAMVSPADFQATDSSLDGTPNGRAQERANLLKTRLYSQILGHRRTRATLDESWEERVMGDVDAMAGSCRSAVTHYRRALEGFLFATGESKYEAIIERLYHAIIECEREDGNLDGAIDVASELLDYLANDPQGDARRSSWDHSERLARARILRGNLFLTMGNPREASQDLEAAEEEYDALFEESGVGRAEGVDMLLTLGKMSMEDGRMDAAIDRFEKAQQLLEGKMQDVDDRRRNEFLRHVHGQLAAIRALGGDFVGARESLEMELSLGWDYLRSWDGSYAFRRQIASSYLRLGELELAAMRWEDGQLRLHQGVSLILELKDLHEAFGDEESAAQLAMDYGQFLGAFGDLALRTGDPWNALSYYEQALDRFRSAPRGTIDGGAADEALASVWSRLGACHMEFDEPAAAARDYEEEVTVLRRLIGREGEGDFSLRVRLGLAAVRGADAEYSMGEVERAVSKLDEAQVVLGRLQVEGGSDVDIAVDALERHVSRMKRTLGTPLTGLENRQ